MSSKTAFVTGGTGFVGLNLIEQLSTQNWQIVGLHRPTSDLSFIKRFPVHLVEGDILNPASLKEVVPRNVDAVFHVAADISMWSGNNARQTRINLEGTRNVVEAAIAARAKRFVHTSTWNTYGLQQGDISEESPQLSGQSWINYDRTKFLAEEEVRSGIKRGLNAVIVNPCHIFGRYDRHGWARLIIDLHTRWMPGAPPGAGTFCHAEQVANAHIAAAEKGRNGENYLLSGTDASLAEVFRTIGEVMGRKVTDRTLPAWLLRFAARASAGVAAISGKEPQMTPEGVEMVIARARVVSKRAENDLGYQVVPLATMIGDSFNWLREQGLIGDEN